MSLFSLRECQTEIKMAYVVCLHIWVWLSFIVPFVESSLTCLYLLKIIEAAFPERSVFSTLLPFYAVHVKRVYQVLAATVQFSRKIMRIMVGQKAMLYMLHFSWIEKEAIDRTGLHLRVTEPEEPNYTHHPQFGRANALNGAPSRRILYVQQNLQIKCEISGDAKL